MKTIARALLVSTLALLLTCDDAWDPGPADPSVEPAAGQLLELLPSSTLAAVEFLDLAGRWEELRAVPLLARLQDRWLEELGLEAGDVREIASGRVVLAFVADEASLQIVPLAVLNPSSRSLALSRLARGHPLVARDARGAVWIGRPSRARRLERIAVGDGTSLAQDVDMTALAERLPAGGLVRAVLNPRALGRQLRRWAEYEAGKLAGTVAGLLGLELEAVEIAGLRRDLVDGAIVTDAWLGLDGSLVPSTVARALARPSESAVLPADLPAEVWLSWSFRMEAQARMAWLRSLARRDHRGPLRNLDFWIDEFEARSGRDVEADIVGALGERGLVLLTEGQGNEGGSVGWVIVVNSREPERLETSLLDLRGWVAEQIRGRTLDLARPILRDVGDPGGTVHVLGLRSPFGRSLELLFQLTDDHLVLATDRRGLELGVDLASSAASWRTPDWALGDRPADEIAVIRMDALSRIGVVGPPGPIGRSTWHDGLGEFLAGAGPVWLRVEYEEGGVRFNGRLQVDGRAEPAALERR